MTARADVVLSEETVALWRQLRAALARIKEARTNAMTDQELHDALEAKSDYIKKLELALAGLMELLTRKITRVDVDAARERAAAAEARAQRYAEALRDCAMVMEDIKPDDWEPEFMDVWTSTLESAKAALSDAEPETGEKK